MLVIRTPNPTRPARHDRRQDTHDAYDEQHTKTGPDSLTPGAIVAESLLVRLVNGGGVGDTAFEVCGRVWVGTGGEVGFRGGCWCGVGVRSWWWCAGGGFGGMVGWHCWWYGGRMWLLCVVDDDFVGDFAPGKGKGLLVVCCWLAYDFERMRRKYRYEEL